MSPVGNVTPRAGSARKVRDLENAALLCSRGRCPHTVSAPLSGRRSQMCLWFMLELLPELLVLVAEAAARNGLCHGPPRAAEEALSASRAAKSRRVCAESRRMRLPQSLFGRGPSEAEVAVEVAKRVAPEPPA